MGQNADDNICDNCGHLEVHHDKEGCHRILAATDFGTGAHVCTCKEFVQRGRTAETDQAKDQEDIDEIIDQWKAAREMWQVRQEQFDEAKSQYSVAYETYKRAADREIELWDKIVAYRNEYDGNERE